MIRKGQGCCKATSLRTGRIGSNLEAIYRRWTLILPEPHGECCPTGVERIQGVAVGDVLSREALIVGEVLILLLKHLLDYKPSLWTHPDLHVEADRAGDSF